MKQNTAAMSNFAKVLAYGFNLSTEAATGLAGALGPVAIAVAAIGAGALIYDALTESMGEAVKKAEGLTCRMWAAYISTSWTDSFVR